MYSVLHLGLSYACNLRCKHCFVNRMNDSLPYEKIIEIIDKLCEQGLMVLYYTFGEPLLANNLFEVAEYARSKNLIQILMTNGVLITEQKAEYIKRAGFSNVYVSIDSSNSLEHDYNRGSSGVFTAAINGIRILQKQEINVGISTAVTNKNVHQLKEIYEIAAKEKVKIISFLRARKNGTMVPLDNNSKNEYVNFVLYGIKQKSISLKFHDLELLPLLKEWKENNLISKEDFDKYFAMSCCHANSTLSIAPNGDISNCNLSQNIIGNIWEIPIEKIIERSIFDEDIIHCTTVSE